MHFVKHLKRLCRRTRCNVQMGDNTWSEWKLESAGVASRSCSAIKSKSILFIKLRMTLRLRYQDYWAFGLSHFWTIDTQP